MLLDLLTTVDSLVAAVQADPSELVRANWFQTVR